MKNGQENAYNLIVDFLYQAWIYRRRKNIK